MGKTGVVSDAWERTMRVFCEIGEVMSLSRTEVKDHMETYNIVTGHCLFMERGIFIKKLTRLSV